MEIIHADSSLVQLREIMLYSLDAVTSLSTDYADNDFELTVSEQTWLDNPIQLGHYIFETGSEWGGRVEGITHVGTDIQLTGPTWRGMLTRKIIKPQTGQSHKVIAAMEANAAIGELLGSSINALFKASADNSGITVSGSFRYGNLLAAINVLLDDANARLKVVFDGTTVTLSVELVSDLSSDTEMSQDYSAPVRSSIKFGSSFNHVIALGPGSLTSRMVAEYYRDDITGVISTTPIADDIDDRQYVLDYPNAADATILALAAQESLKERSPVTKVEIDLSAMEDLQLGDIVGGRDQITGLSISKPVTQIILKVNQDGTKYEYKVGE